MVTRDGDGTNSHARHITLMSEMPKPHPFAVGCKAKKTVDYTILFVPAYWQCRVRMNGKNNTEAVTAASEHIYAVQKPSLSTTSPYIAVTCCTESQLCVSVIQQI